VARLTPNPILKVLSSIRKSGVKALLMGGQACVFYGAAEFSRDIDLLILADPENLESLRRALAELQAESIAVPPFDATYLARGHALHFRCHREDVADLRIDIMSRYRGGSGFDDLWRRRTTIDVAGHQIDLLSLQDLVTAKKTQRDKDWPMITRLMERSYFETADTAGEEQLEFLLRELRTPDLLIELAGRHPATAARFQDIRPAIAGALRADAEDVEDALDQEESQERQRDREFWQPLKLQLEQLRRERANQKL
jgi:hypothetical protein